jgi:hypothetical protein
MNAGQLAALIAAVFFAAGVCVAAYALVKLAGLATAATGFLTGMHERTDLLIDEAHAAIGRTNEQLDRTDAITANMTEVSANVAELTEHVSALAALGRALTVGPVGKASAVAYGVRHALDLRRDSSGSALMASAAAPGRRPAPGTAAAPGRPPAPGTGAGSAAVPAQRPAPQVSAGRAAGSAPRRASGQDAVSAAARQAGSAAVRTVGSAAARRAGSLAMRGAGVAGRTLAARAIGRSVR